MFSLYLGSTFTRLKAFDGKEARIEATIITSLIDSSDFDSKIKAANSFTGSPVLDA